MAKVPKSGGASLTRGSYQKGYSLGNRGGATPKAAGGSASVKGETGAKLSAGSKGGGATKAKDAGDMNISYGDTLPIGDLQSVADFGKDAKAGKQLKPIKPTSYAKQKGDSGSGFNVGKRR